MNRLGTSHKLSISDSEGICPKDYFFMRFYKIPTNIAKLIIYNKNEDNYKRLVKRQRMHLFLRIGYSSLCLDISDYPPKAFISVLG